MNKLGAILIIFFSLFSSFLFLNHVSDGNLLKDIKKEVFSINVKKENIFYIESNYNKDNYGKKGFSDRTTTNIINSEAHQVKQGLKKEKIVVLNKNEGKSFEDNLIPDSGYTAKNSIIVDDKPKIDSSTLPKNEEIKSVPNNSSQYFFVENTKKVLVPTLDRIELVTDFALNHENSLKMIGNNWGGNQTRILRTNAGDIYILFFDVNQNGKHVWKLVKRSGSSFLTIATEETIDDAYLLYDKKFDRIIIIAYPDGMPAFYYSPNYSMNRINFDYQKLSGTTRSYGASSISNDGKICFKVGREDTHPNSLTKNTDVVITCGESNSNGIVFDKYISKDLGFRHNYDYIFLSTVGGLSKVLGVSERDLWKTTAGLPNLLGGYSFNGIRFYESDINSSFFSNLNYKNLVDPINTFSNDTVSPSTILTDSYIDTKNRLLSTYFASDPNDVNKRGHYLVNYNLLDGAKNIDKLKLPTYGFVRILENKEGKLFLFFSNRGTIDSEVRVYELLDYQENGGVHFKVSQDYIDLSKSFFLLPFDQSVYLASVRGGSQGTNIADMFMSVCTNGYPSLNKPCSDPSTKYQKIYYFRVLLP